MNEEGRPVASAGVGLQREQELQKTAAVAMDRIGHFAVCTQFDELIDEAPVMVVQIQPNKDAVLAHAGA
ncbi:MAG: hypothetical protein KFB96_25660 [Thiocapsa sp.]|uniref:hypothetical protein n=1 Tax=Thiocapsa sp. TaxID=2024551 RepID=UPI001BCB94B8|nr:hypothetical protein [Thiocapsa sp.]QVL48879.1 MAG: hypothetical protein KFB96_25660 [Thiocapsa sp.]